MDEQNLNTNAQPSATPAPAPAPAVPAVPPQATVRIVPRAMSIAPDAGPVSIQRVTPDTPNANMGMGAGYKRELKAAEETVLQPFRAAARAMWREHDITKLLVFLQQFFSCTPPTQVLVGDQYQNSYDPQRQVIMLDKFSVVSLLHEYWHHVQKVFGVDGANRFLVDNSDATLLQVPGDTEEGARVFSVSLYGKAFPILYAKMVAAGRLIWY